MIHELIVFGGFWFWALTIAFGICFGISTFLEKVYETSASVIVFLLTLTFFSNVNIFSFLYQNLTWSICLAIIYVIAGIIWSIAKWYLFNTKIKYIYNETRNEFIRDKKISDNKIPEEHISSWKTIISQPGRWIPVTKYYDFEIPYSITSVKDIVPSAGSYKQQITYWMMYWPLSLLFFFLSDFLERLFNRIYQLVSQIFVSISNRVFKSIQDDFVQPERRNHV